MAVLEKFRLEYDELTELRRRVDTRLAQLHVAIAALTAADNREPLKFEGSLSDACRTILKGATKPMAPTEVRDGVVGIGFQLSSLSHGNPMASVHSVLKRFVDSGDAESEPTKDGTKYRWTGRARTERAITSLSAASLGSMGDTLRDSVGLSNDMLRAAQKAFGDFHASGALAEAAKTLDVLANPSIKIPHDSLASITEANSVLNAERAVGSVALNQALAKPKK